MSIMKKLAGAFVELPQDPQPVGAATVASNGKNPSPDQVAKELAALNAQLSSGGRSIEQLAAQTPGPNLDQVQVKEPEKAPMVTADGKLDFDAVYRVAGIPEDAYDAEQALEMFSTLPAELPNDAKLKALGQLLATINRMNPAAQVTPDTLVADAGRKITALHSYSDGISSQVKQYLAGCDSQIADFKKKIAALEASKTAAAEQSNLTTKVCNGEIERLQEVPKFFAAGNPMHIDFTIPTGVKV